jgi:hypothetical protein
VTRLPRSSLKARASSGLCTPRVAAAHPAPLRRRLDLGGSYRICGAGALGNSKEAIPANVYDTLKSALVDKTKAENLLIKYYTNTDYTIVRPGLDVRLLALARAWP